MRLGFGVDLVVDQLATGLAERGHSVTVFTCYTDGTYEAGPYRIVPLPIPGHPEALVWDVRARQAALGSGLYDQLFDVWFALTPPFFSLLPRLKGRGIAVDCGVSDSTGMSAKQRRNFRTTELLQQRWYFRSAARVITISGWLHNQLPLSLQSRSLPILLGADHYPLAGPGAREAARRKLGVSDDEVLSLYVGRLNPRHQPYKGTERLLAMHQDVVDKYPEARLALVGFGSEGDAEWVQSNGGIPFLNAPVEEMPGMFAAADLYVTASSWEGFDLPLVEAQRSGKGVVAFRLGAHPEVVDDGRTGMLVEDESEFVAALRQLVHDRERREELGAAAAEWGARFRWHDVVTAYDELITDVMNEVGPALVRPTGGVSVEDAVADTGADSLAVPADPRECFHHPTISVLILNYGADVGTLSRCVASVLESQCQRVVEIIVADNGSERNLAALDVVAALDDKVRILRLGHNFGFAGGINRGLAICRGDWIMILNNDTEVDPLALDACANVLATQAPECLAAVPKLLLRGARGFIDAVGNAVDGMGQAFNVGVGQVDVGQYDTAVRVFGPCFAAALFRREGFDVNQVGPLDGSYFMYYEDVDWSWRANLMGYRFQSAPQAKVYHEHSKTTREQPPEFKVRHIHSHLLTTVAKNMGSKAAVRVTGHHLAAHIRAAVRGDMRATRVRLMASAARRLPSAMVKRRWTRQRQVVPDEVVLGLGEVEMNCFDTTIYAPILNLSAVSTAYRRKWLSTGDPRWSEVADRAAWFAGRATNEPGVLRRTILPLLEGEPEVVRTLIRNLDPLPTAIAE